MACIASTSRGAQLRIFVVRGAVDCLYNHRQALRLMGNPFPQQKAALDSGYGPAVHHANEVRLPKWNKCGLLAEGRRPGGRVFRLA